MSFVITDSIDLVLAQPGMDSTYNEKMEDPLHQIARDILGTAFTVNGKHFPSPDAKGLDAFEHGLLFYELAEKAQVFYGDPTPENRNSFKKEFIKLLQLELQLSEEQCNRFITSYSQKLLYPAQRITAFFGPFGENKADFSVKNGVIHCDTTKIHAKSFDEEQNKIVEKDYSGEVKASLKFENNQWSLEKIEATGECADELEKRFPQKDKILEFQNSINKIRQDESRAEELTENIFQLRNYLSETLFYICQRQSPDKFNEIIENTPEIMDTFDAEMIVEIQDGFKIYHDIIKNDIDKSIQKEGVKEAYRVNNPAKIRPDTFVNHVVTFIQNTRKITKDQEVSPEKFLKDLKDIITKTEWSVGFLGFGGEKYHNKNYPKHIYKILKTIDENLSNDNASWEKTFEAVKKISEEASSSSSLFRKKNTTDTYRALREGLAEIRKSDEPPASSENPHPH